MLDECEEFGEQYGVRYNASKTVCIQFTRKKSDDTNKSFIKFCKTELKWYNVIKFLGTRVYVCQIV